MMRDLEECREEVFWRSRQRIEKRRKIRNGIWICCIPLCLILLTLWSTAKIQDKPDAENDFVGRNETAKIDEDGAYESFSFSLTWDCYGISSYDSETGRLVKTKDATDPQDYITTYYLTDAQRQQIYGVIMDLDVSSYPDIYDPHGNGLASDPSMTLILTVQTGTIQKTITAADIAMSYESKDEQGQRFLSACKMIRDILTATEEWKALPEYENFYD